MPRNFMASRERFYDDLDHRGTIEYTSGNDKFDDTVGKRWHAARPQELSFTNQYPEAEIRADLAEIQRIEQSETYLRERSPISAMAETTIAEGLGKRCWLGPDSSATITSKYDDIKSGADFVATIPDRDTPGNGSIPFAIDVTVSEQPHILNQKITSELNRLVHNDRVKLKYAPVNKPINRYVVAVPGEQVRAMADVVINRSSDPTVEYQIQLELADELAYQAFRQIDFVLRQYRVPGYEKSSEPAAVRQFLEKHWPQVAGKLPPEIADSVRVNRAIMKHMTERRQAIRADAAKKIGVTILDRNSVPTPVAHLLSFDPDRILGRAA